MKTDAPKFDAEELNLFSLAQQYSDDDKARGLLETLRWPNGPVCPHCKNDGKAKAIYSVTPKATSKRPARAGLYKCGACREQFTVTVDTIFDGSHVPISKWLMAVFILCSSKKAISAHQMHRMLKVTYKTAWFMCHRIRYAMQPEMPLGRLLTGTVEVDETFVGGKGDRKTKHSRKTPVVALVERGGDVQTRVVASVTQKNLKQCLQECVDKGATVNTDQHGAYPVVARDFERHEVVNHSKFEYHRKNTDGTVATTNTAESFFSLLKRGVFGAWHHVSREHLPKYAAEFAFRWNARKITDGERMVEAVKMVEGKRLTYKPLIGA